jgi:hypothetical protein
MKDEPDNFNLLVEPWIPVLYTNGQTDRVGIRKALTKAGRIRQIAASNPMDNVALLRLLLAVLQWCKPSMSEDEKTILERAEGIPDTWLKQKLGSNERPNGLFELLSSNGGFFQDQAAGGVRVSVMNLMHDLPSGSKIAHFRHARDGSGGMCLPCCALGLVRWPSVASAGTAGAGQSMTASLNGNTPAYSVPIGGSFLATLLLTWPFNDAVQGDAPVWDAAGEFAPLGFLKGMTWQSRRILLAPPSETNKRDLSSGRCCYCGEPTDRLVRSILFRPGWRRPFKEPWSDDPHLLRITRKTGQKTKEKKIVPSWPNPNDPLEDHAGVWRSVLEGLLQRSAAAQTSPAVRHTMLLANSQALYKHVGMHRSALPEMSVDVAQRLSNELQWLEQLTWITASARGGNWSNPPKGHVVVGALCAAGAKGHNVRSGLCARSPLTECELETAFLRLTYDLTDAGPAGGNAIQWVVDDWRSRASRIIQEQVKQVLVAATPGSPLRCQEAAQSAERAVREALRRVEEQMAKAANKPKPGRGK